MYQPAAGDRIIVRRTSPTGRIGVMVGTVRAIVTLPADRGRPEATGVLRFQEDGRASAVPLATSEQLAPLGYTQTYAPATS